LRSGVKDASSDILKCPNINFKDLLANNRPVFVLAGLQSGTTSFKHKSLLDIGSDICLIKRSIIRRNNLEGSIFGRGQQIIGVGNNPVTSVGSIKLDVQLENMCFPSILFDVMDSIPVPLIIGRSLLQERASAVHFDWSKSEVRIFRNFGTDQGHGVAPLLNPGGVLACTAQSPDKLQLLFETCGVSFNEANSEFSDSQKAKMADLLLSYQDAFAVEGGEIGLYPIEAKIPTIPGKTFKQKQHLIAQGHRHIVDKEVHDMYEAGIIEDCTDSKGWNSPVFIVEKSDGSPRFVVNFKQTLNLALVEEDTFVVSCCEDTLREIGLENELYGSFDFKSGYWQVGLVSEHRHKTAFCWGGRNYQFTRVPFGLKTSGNIFSRAVSHALREAVASEGLSVYVDDIFLYCRNFEQYINIVEKVLKGCISHNVRLSGKKTKLFLKEAKFLGRWITKTGYLPVKEYSQGIESITIPQNRNQLQVLIGRLLWCKVHLEARIGERVAQDSFAALTKPMTTLLKNKKFVWTKKAQEAFDKAIDRLKSAPICRFADFDRQFILVTDASQFAAGAVLMQVDEDDCPYIVASASKTFSDVQRRWSTIEREAFAIVFAVVRFKYFLSAREFIIKTDHRPLTFMDKSNIRNSKVERWYQVISQFRFILQYIPGPENQLADLMSRPDGVDSAMPVRGEEKVQGEFFDFEGMMIYRPSWINKMAKPCKLDIDDVIPEVRTILNLSTMKAFNDESLLDNMDEISEAQREDPVCDQIIEGLRTNTGLGFLKDLEEPNYLKFRGRFKLHPVSRILMISTPSDGDKVFVPPKLRAPIVYHFHNDHYHVGTNKVVEFVRRIYFWPMMNSEIKNFVQSCSVCVARKGSAANQSPPMLHLPRPSGQWQVCYMDFVAFSESIGGYKYVLTYICGFSRYLITIPVRSESAVACARALVDKVFLPYTRPLVLSCDRGSAFKSTLVHETCRAFGTELKLHVAWRPESTGVLERIHRILKDMIYITCYDKKMNWVQALPLVTRALNVSYHSAIGVSPYEVIFGHKDKMGGVSLDFRPNSDSPMSQAVIGKINLDTIKQIVIRYQKSADDESDEAKSKSTAVELEVGQEIFLNRPRTAIAKEHNFRMVGPYKVIGTNGSVVKIADDTGHEDFVHRAHVCPAIERSEKYDIFDNVALPIPTIKTAEKPSLNPVIGSSVANCVLPPEGIPAPPINPVNTGTPRYPKRDRTRKNERLNIASTSGKTY
jgi:hypothetical protein